MANPNIAGLPGSWKQGSIAAIVGGSVGPIGSVVVPAPPGDDFLLAVKPADTTRTNTTTTTPDPDLVITGLPAGFFAYSMLLECIAASTTPDFKYQLAVTAGVGDGVSAGFEHFQSVAAIEIRQTNVFLTNNPPIIANFPTYVSVRGFIELSLAGDVSLDWSQDTLDAVNGTTLRAGSWLRIEEANA